MHACTSMKSGKVSLRVGAYATLVPAPAEEASTLYILPLHLASHLGVINEVPRLSHSSYSSFPLPLISNNPQLSLAAAYIPSNLLSTSSPLHPPLFLHRYPLGASSAIPASAKLIVTPSCSFQTGTHSPLCPYGLSVDNNLIAQKLTIVPGVWGCRRARCRVRGYWRDGWGFRGSEGGVGGE